MRNYLMCLAGLFLVYQLQGQDYYVKPKSHRFTITAGTSFQYLKTYENALITRATNDPSLLNYQVGISYEYPYSILKVEGLTFNPEVIFRHNRARQQYTMLWGIPNTQMGEMREYSVKGVSGVLLLPMKYMYKKTIGLSAGLFAELPLSVKYHEQVWLHNQLTVPDHFQTVSEGESKTIGKGWQVAFEAGDTRHFQVRVFMSHRIRQSSLLSGSSICGLVLGWKP